MVQGAMTTLGRAEMIFSITDFKKCSALEMIPIQNSVSLEYFASQKKKKGCSQDERWQDSNYEGNENREVMEL